MKTYVGVFAKGVSNEYHNICFCGEIRKTINTFGLICLFVLRFYGPVNPMRSR